MMSTSIGTCSEQLNKLNQELALLFHCPPASLALGAERALGDSLVVCGIMGGKDVGKSTLINALAGAKVSIDDQEAGAGTSKPQVYVHADSVAQVQARFREGPIQSGDSTASETLFAADWHEHRADRIKNVVLIDLPDFDSEFPHHSQIVEEVAPHLDRVLWVLTPRKIADRAWVELFRNVAKDHANVYYILNKMDEVVAEAFHGNGRTAILPPDQSRDRKGAVLARPQSIAGFWHEQLNWFQGLLRGGQNEPNTDRLFLLSAQYGDAPRLTQRIAHVWEDPQWSRYAAERSAVQSLAERLAEELERLRRSVLVPVTANEATALKEANRVAEIEHVRERLRVYYQLDHWKNVLDRACSVEYQQSLINDVFGQGFCRDNARRLADRLLTHDELARELFAWRVQRWPILRALYHPLSGLAGFLGRRLISPSSSLTGHDRDVAVTRDGESLAMRCESLRERLRSEHERLLNHFHLHDESPDGAKFAERFLTRCDRLREELDGRALDLLKQQTRQPRWPARAMLWAVLLWFPLVQPIAEGALEVLSGGGGVMPTLHGAYKLVWALGAAQLLKGLVVVLAVYMVCLTVIYARCARDARRFRLDASAAVAPQDAGSEGLSEEIDLALSEEIVLPLMRPLITVRDSLHRIEEQLNRMTA